MEEGNSNQDQAAAPSGMIINKRRNNRLSVSRSHFTSRFSDSSLDQGMLVSSLNIPDEHIRQESLNFTLHELNLKNEGPVSAAEEQERGRRSPSRSSRRSGSPSLLHFNEEEQEELDDDEEEEEETYTPRQRHLNIEEETIPLIPATPLTPKPVLSSFEIFREVAITGASSLPAVFLAILLTLLDAVSYGIIIFPHTDPRMPSTSPQAGIGMFLSSTLISQLIFTFGGSKFSGVVGSEMIEVIPFLHLMVLTIEKEAISESVILPTVMIAYASSTILTGFTFLFIGFLKLGNLIQYFPRHILIGCIGGIGLFLILTAIEVVSHIAPPVNFQYLHDLFELTSIKLWGSSLGVAILLKLLQTIPLFNRPSLIPIFYTLVPTVFYCIVFAFKIPLHSLREEGWLFNFPLSADVPFYTYWSYFNFTLIDWRAWALTIPTQFALIFFSLLHVPINLPAFARSTNQAIDLNAELLGHGYSNLASGLFGSIQNYIVYSNSLLYFNSGGNSKISGLLLAMATLVLWVWGAWIIDFIPSVAVGALIFHLGIDLLKESIWDTWAVGLHGLEYLTIWIIVLVMGVVGFTEGVVVGIILACVSFVYLNSKTNVIRDSYTGSQIRSVVHRLYRQQLFLDRVGNQIHLVKLQGFIFFGTINQLEIYFENILSSNPGIRFFILDFGLISGCDYSGLETLLKIKRNLLRLPNTHLIFTGITMVQKEIERSGLLETEENNDEINLHRLHIFDTLNSALEWTENYLLSAYYLKAGSSGPRQSATNHQHEPLIVANTPRGRTLLETADIIIRENPTLANSSSLPFKSLLQASFSEGVLDEMMLEIITPHFNRKSFMKNELIYASGSDAGGLFLVESGQLGLSVSVKRGEEVIVETMLAGALVGELETFAGRPRFSSLVSLTDSTVWMLSKVKFDELCLLHPGEMLLFMRSVALPYDVTRLSSALSHTTTK